MVPSIRPRRWLGVGAAATLVVAASLAVILPSLAATTHVVNSIAALQSALGSAAPGDVILLADGSYATSGTITISRSGNTSAPITVAAQHVGGATLSGSGGRSFRGGVSNAGLARFPFPASPGLCMPAGGPRTRIPP